MWLIVGLGNPGAQYDRTRHNIGFRAVDFLSEKNLVAGEKIIFLKPQDFMNLSGRAVAEKINFYKIPHDHLVVIHDDLDFTFGAVKAQFDRSAAGHNGIIDIIEKIGGQDFHRIRVGIGPQTGAAENFVLQPFTTEEEKQFPEIFDKVLSLVQDIVKI